MTDQATNQVISFYCQQAREAAFELSASDGSVRNHAIQEMVHQLDSYREQLNAANREDVNQARQNRLSPALIKRLEITDKVFQYMKDRLQAMATQPDPLGRVLEGHTAEDGLKVYRLTVPIGVIGMIYEARPNVTTDAASVCLKSGNATILRGGTESIRSNRVLAEAMQNALETVGLPRSAVQLVSDPSRDLVTELLQRDEDIDVLIPRGGKSLIEHVTRESRIPVIKHYDGICHLYLAEDAEEDMAISLVLNSKCQRVEVCNALETVLLDSNCAERLLPSLVTALVKHDVTVKGCERSREIVSHIEQATEEDWQTEYLAPVLAVRIVDGLQQAASHIREYGSGHTDGIVTASLSKSRAFISSVDSASVLVNASTRLSGGGAYGLGAVVGISTGKLHARGPVGPANLTSYKWIAEGTGHLRGA